MRKEGEKTGDSSEALASEEKLNKEIAGAHCSESVQKEVCDIPGALIE